MIFFTESTPRPYMSIVLVELKRELWVLIIRYIGYVAASEQRRGGPCCWGWGWASEEGEAEVGEYGGEGVSWGLWTLRRRPLRERSDRSWRETGGRTLTRKLRLRCKLRWRLGRRWASPSFIHHIGCKADWRGTRGDHLCPCGKTFMWRQKAFHKLPYLRIWGDFCTVSLRQLKSQL